MTSLTIFLIHSIGKTSTHICLGMHSTVEKDGRLVEAHQTKIQVSKKISTITRRPERISANHFFKEILAYEEISKRLH